ncbi:hypothetical protein ACYOEI_05075 [Singulisphaera rosea]
MNKRSLEWAILFTLMVGGCTKDEGKFPGASATEVDRSLPAEAQQRQGIIRGALMSLQEGYPIERLKGFLPRVKFVESGSRFLDGAKYFESWRFNGRPSGDEVPVSLFFTFEDPANAGPKRVDRVYLVKGTSGRFTVTRK